MSLGHDDPSEEILEANNYRTLESALSKSKAEVKSLRRLLAKERDEFGKKETELVAEVKRLIGESEGYKLNRDALEQEVKRLTEELYKPCRQCEAELKKQGELIKDLDFWKSLCEKMEGALKKIAERNPYDLDSCLSIAYEVFQSHDSARGERG
jgi:predicted  nucleic acid-binding Zn-ribbon protein